jgi:hypothetical protein
MDGERGLAWTFFLRTYPSMELILADPLDTPLLLEILDQKKAGNKYGW